jgi:hypothetical protein
MDELITSIAGIRLVVGACHGSEFLFGKTLGTRVMFYSELSV